VREEGGGDRTRRYRTPTSPARFNFRTKKDESDCGGGDRERGHPDLPGNGGGVLLRSGLLEPGQRVSSLNGRRHGPPTNRVPLHALLLPRSRTGAKLPEGLSGGTRSPNGGYPISARAHTIDAGLRLTRKGGRRGHRGQLLLTPASHLRYIQRDEDLYSATPSRRASTSQSGRASAARRRNALLFHRRCRRGTGSEPGDGGRVHRARSGLRGESTSVWQVHARCPGCRRTAAPARRRSQGCVAQAR